MNDRALDVGLRSPHSRECLHFWAQCETLGTASAVQCTGATRLLAAAAVAAVAAEMAVAAIAIPQCISMKKRATPARHDGQPTSGENYCSSRLRLLARRGPLRRVETSQSPP